VAPMTVDQANRILSEWLISKPEEVKAQKAAMEYYGSYFSPQNLSNVTQEGFKDFLLLKNNKHWSGLHRQPQIYENMDRLRQCLELLLDESRPLEQRLDVIAPKGKPPYIKGLGRAVITPILMCVYPDKYAVYNRISDEGLTKLGRNTIRESDSFSKRYQSLNATCHQLSSEIQQPLYLIDSMFSLMVQGIESPLTMLLRETGGMKPGPNGDPPDDGRETGASECSAAFSLEKYLQEFIVSNWSKTPLAKKLELYKEDEEEAVEFKTGVGEIDILARDRSTGDWVVIELKKGQESDKVVGQVLRYMGWILNHKAGAGEKVRGIIITGMPDDRIKYAVSASHGIEFFTYRVSFDLVEEKMGNHLIHSPT
jgi:Endonuclease NucS